VPNPPNLESKSAQPKTFDRNVYGQPLLPCSFEPRTGFFRDGCCKTDQHDHGRHVVCALMTQEFLSFSKSRGNDLTTAMPQYDFPGLKPGDRWCLCAMRWKEALDAQVAPKVFLESTHIKALDYIALESLQAFAAES
jgi:uncharacterized protein